MESDEWHLKTPVLRSRTLRPEATRFLWLCTPAFLIERERPRMDPLMPPRGSILIPFLFLPHEPSFFHIFNPLLKLLPKIRKKAQALPTGNAFALIIFSCLSTSQDNSTNELLISLILLVYFINDLLTTLCKPSISCCLKTCLVDLTTDVLGSSLLDDLIQSSSYIRVGSRVSKVA